jgi:hypothetical protein
MGREKKRAKEIIEAESLSVGRPVEVIRDAMERGFEGDERAGGDAVVFAACAGDVFAA